MSHASSLQSEPELICSLYQTEEAFPECPPDSCVIHVVCYGL